MGNSMQALLDQAIAPPREDAILYIATKCSKLYLGDAVDTLNRLPAVDMIFADPPYNLSNDGTRVVPYI